MKKTTTLLATAACALASAIPAFADNEGLATPEFTVGIDYSTRQISRGLPDNPDPIATLSGAIEWEGFTVEVDGIFNTTDIWEEDGFDRFDNTEIDYIVGYGYTFGADDFGLPTDIEVGVDYTYEFDQGGNESNDHVQYIHGSIGLPEVFLSPTVTGEWMLDQFHGQYYTFELSHTFELLAAEEEGADPALGLTLGFCQGLGNDKYNDDDLGKDFWAFRESTFTASLDWAVCGGLTLSPYIAYSDTWSGTVRDAAKYYEDEEAKHSVGQIYGGIAAAATF